MSETTSTLPKRLAGPRKKRSQFGRNNLVGYLFISPWLIAFFLFAFIPIVVSFGLSFTNYHILRGWEYIGLDNFHRMFYEDRRYWNSVRATVKYVAFAVPLRLVFALAVAMLLNTKRRGVAIYRAAFYAPSVVGGSIAVAVMWREIFSREGLANFLMGQFGQPSIWWLGHPDYAIWTLILLAAWQFGSPMLIFLAGLKQIPEQLYESASIDGANATQKFFRITLPLLTPVIFFNLVMQLIAGFMTFTQAFIISNGSGRPLDTTLLYALYLYKRGFETYEMGYAAAMAWVMLVVVAILTGIVFSTSSRWVYYESQEVN
jgi:multiple sugar transport system permease protein